MSPGLPVPSSSAPGAGKKPPRSSAGSGSEGEAAGSGGEMSDGTKQRIKLKFRGGQGSRNGTPQMSRAGSPAAPPARTETPGTSPFVLVPRTLYSVNKNDGKAKDDCEIDIANENTPLEPLPTAEDIRSKIPPQGIRVGDLISFYKGSVVGEERKGQFTKLMRQASRYDKDTKLLKPLK